MEKKTIQLVNLEYCLRHKQKLNNYISTRNYPYSSHNLQKIQN